METQSAEPTPTPSPTAEPTPDPMSAGELVLKATHEYFFGSPWTSISLVADGRMTFPSDGGWKVRVLSPSGVDRVRTEAAATGLFSETADYRLVPVPNQDINCTDGLGLTSSAAIELVTDEGPVIVTWQRPSGPEGCWESTTTLEAMESLLAKLESPNDWLPLDAWQDPTLKPYESHGYRMITIAQPRLQDVGNVPEASSVSWPLADSLTTFGEALTPRLYAESWTVRCGVVNPDEARRVQSALTDAGATMSDSSPPGFASVALLGARADNATVAVILESLPVGISGCAQLELRFLNCWQVGAIQPFSCAVP
jgi:hypothetical protein